MVQGKSQNICRMFRNHSYFTLKPSRMDFHWHLFCFGKFNDLMYIHVCCKFPFLILQTREGVGVLYLTQTFRDVLDVWQGIDRSTSHAYSYWSARLFLFRFNVGVHLNGYDDWPQRYWIETKRLAILRRGVRYCVYLPVLFMHIT